jgi:hypothetical protein
VTLRRTEKKASSAELRVPLSRQAGRIEQSPALDALKQLASAKSGSIEVTISATVMLSAGFARQRPPVRPREARMRPFETSFATIRIVWSFDSANLAATSEIVTEDVVAVARNIMIRREKSV